jgi:uncharacterized damage-inducible protein DinB
MSRTNEFVEELRAIHSGEAWHGPSLRATLAGISAAQAATRPLSGAHTAWELVAHITAWEDVFRQRINGTRLDQPAEGDFPPCPDSSFEAWDRALARLHRVHEEFVHAVSTLTEAALDATVAGKPYTMRYMLKGAVRHHVYHAGQIAMLKKSLGL